jgi:uncharacterized protein YaaR (DUF327 family)
MAVTIAANTAEFNRALSASQKQLSSFVTGVKGVGAALGVSFGAFTVYRGLSYGIGVLSDFEKEMSAVRAITDATGKDFEDLRSSALELGSATLYSAKSVAELQLAYGRLGFTTSEILKATSATIDLATATGEDLAKSADIAGVTIRAFGLKAIETRRVADILAVGFNKTALGLDNFGEAIKYVAPIAAANNITLEETTALLGTLADAGIRGSMAGTSLRKIISELDKGSGTLSEKLKSLAKSGFTSGEAMDEVGRTAYASLLTLVKYTDKTDELTKATLAANGEISKMAALMSENLAGDVSKLSTAFEGFIIAIGESDAIRHFTRDLAGLFNFLSGNKTGIIQSQLDDLAQTVKNGPDDQEGFFEVDPNFLKPQIEALKELRKESGKPLDENNIIAQLTLRYKLSMEQAEQLSVAIREVNTALSFDETVITKFDKFAESYKDLTKAAEDFIAAQRLAILSNKGSEIKFGQRGDLQAMNAVKADTANYENAINIVKAYVKAKTEAVAAPPPIPEAKVQLGLIQQLEKKIKDFGEAIKTSLNPADIRSYTNSIKLLNEEIDKLTGKKSGITAPTQNVFNQAPELSFIDKDKSAKLMEQALQGIKDKVKALTPEIKGAFLDITGAATSFASSLATILGEGIGNGFQNFGATILEGISGFMKQFGRQLIALGTGFLALKALRVSGPAGAIAAIAAGVALTAIAGSIQSSAQGGIGSAAGGGSSSYVSNRAADRATLNVNVTGELTGQGSTLKAVLRNADYQSSRTGG